MNFIRPLIGRIALATCVAATAHAADAPAPSNDAWYRVEVVIFERGGSVDAASAEEILVSRAPRAFPLDAFAFDDASNRAAAYFLDAETRAQPVRPFAFPAGSASTNRSTLAQQPSAETAEAAIPDYQLRLQERAFRFEPGSTFLLAQEDGRLQRSNLYRVVFHRAWIQPVPDRDQLRPMLIQAGDRVGDQWQIEGTLGVTRGRYLHMDVRLWFAVAAAAAPAGSMAAPIPDDVDGAPYMELREQRRMRSGELHYLDHPKFGVLARIDPVQAPDESPAESSAAPTGR